LVYIMIIGKPQTNNSIQRVEYIRQTTSTNGIITEPIHDAGDLLLMWSCSTSLTDAGTPTNYIRKTFIKGSSAAFNCAGYLDYRIGDGNPITIDYPSASIAPMCCLVFKNGIDVIATSNSGQGNSMDSLSVISPKGMNKHLLFCLNNQKGEASSSLSELYNSTGTIIATNKSQIFMEDNTITIKEIFGQTVLDNTLTRGWATISVIVTNGKI
jgi:hypothetical protein